MVSIRIGRSSVKMNGSLLVKGEPRLFVISWFTNVSCQREENNFFSTAVLLLK
jgi:hypothetical protein